MTAEAAMFSAQWIAEKPVNATFESLGELEELPLPQNFAWGAASAAYQVEGAPDAGGKGASIWDTFTHLEPSRTSGESGDVACDHYNRMPEDVALMASLGMEVYRFSISWTRIIPKGGRDDPISKEGIAFYDRLIDNLLERNMEPVVTLYHWDLPQALYDRYGGFLDAAEIQADFENYANVAFAHFGDRVKKWVTFNEPYIISIFAYLNGTLAPGHCRDMGTDTRTEPWRVGHSLILSHARAVKLYADRYRPAQRGEISIVLNGHFYEPFDAGCAKDVRAAEQRMVFYMAWFGDPIFLGRDYPKEMRSYLGTRIPTFTASELDLLRQTASINAFYGMNHYSTKFAKQLRTPPADDDWTGNIEETSSNSQGREIGPASSSAWLRVAPSGFRKLMNWIWKRYRLPIIITENGCPCAGEDDLNTAVSDTFRQRYIGLYLDAISRAIYEDGVNVRGYYVWSLMDNFEWSAGFGPRFGVVHVDYKTLERTPKSSAYYLRDTLQKRRQG